MADLLNTPQLALPFNLVGDSIATVQQDSEIDVVQNAEVVLRYTKGERAAVPDFGIPDQAFRQNGINAREVVSDVKRWEPNADVEIVSQAVDNLTGTQYNEVTLGADDLNG